MASIASLLVLVDGNTTGLSAALGKGAASVKAFGVSTTASSAEAGQGISKFGLVAGAVAVAAGVALVKFAADSVKAFEESEAVMAQTTAVIESTGGAAGYTAEQIHLMAGALQEATTFSDEEIQSAENLLLTFRSIGHEALPQATQAVLDMSTALGQDLKSSSIQLGKALNDPLIGLTALRRVGVAFTADQVHMIKALVEQNDLFGAQKIILGEVAAEFGGSASAATQTFAGQVQQLANDWNDLQEKFGEFVAEAGPPLIRLLTRLIDLVDELAPVMKTLGENVVDQTLKWDEWSQKNVAAAAALDAMSEHFSGAKAGIQDLTGGLDDYIRAAGDSEQGTGFFSGTVADFAGTAAAATAATADYTQALRDALTATLAATDATFGIIDAFTQDTSAAQELIGAQNHLNQLIDAGKTSGHAYQQALDDVSTAALASARAHAGLLGTVADLQAKIDDGSMTRRQAITDLRDMADSAGLTKAQTKLLVEELRQGIAALQDWNTTPFDDKTSIVTIEQRFHQLGVPPPGYAAGGTMATSGVALVGERGPELVYLPGGAQISPHVPAMAGLTSVSGVSSGGITVEERQALAREVGEEVAAAFARAGGLQPVIVREEFDAASSKYISKTGAGRRSL